MALFSRKPKEDKKVQADEETPVERVKIAPSDEVIIPKKPEISPEQKARLEAFGEFQKEYGSMFGTDLVYHEALALNLQFAIYSELRKLNEQMRKALELDGSE